MLNKVDTSNLLKAINITRDLFSNIKAPTIPKIQPAVASGGGDQVFHIAKLEFPNVRNGKDLQDAILNLPLIAKQKVRTT